MQKYEVLTSVTFEHKYSANACFGFIIPVLTRRQEARLFNSVLLFKETEAGLTVQFDKNEY